MVKKCSKVRCQNYVKFSWMAKFLYIIVLVQLVYSIQLSSPTMPNNSLALTCYSPQLQNLVSVGCLPTKSQLSIIAQQSDSFGCNKWWYSTQPYGYTITYIFVLKSNIKKDKMKINFKSKRMCYTKGSSIMK